LLYFNYLIKTATYVYEKISFMACP
jgi:hypothetical protein